MGNTVKAKLKRRDGAYTWNGNDGEDSLWMIVKDHEGRVPFYRVTSDSLGLTFEASSLTEVRKRLPAVVVAYCEHGLILDYVDKTRERVEREMKERPFEKKLAAADKRIMDRLKSANKEANRLYNEFMQKLQDAGPRGFSYTLKWKGHGIAKLSYLMTRYNFFLENPSESSPQERMDRIVGLHAQFHNRLMESTFHSDKVKADLHGVVEHEGRLSVVEFFHLLNEFLAIYKEEYVENIPEPFSGIYW